MNCPPLKKGGGREGKETKGNERKGTKGKARNERKGKKKRETVLLGRGRGGDSVTWKPLCSWLKSLGPCTETSADAS